MSSRYRLFLTLAIMLGIASGCGFEPVYGKKESRTSLSSIQIMPIPERSGQILKSTMEDEIVEFTEPRYALQVNYGLNSVPVVTQVQGIAKRYRLVLRANIVLTDIATGTVLLRDTVKRQASYNISDSDYSSFVSARATEEMALRELGHDIIMRLALFMERAPTDENPSTGD